MRIITLNEESRQDILTNLLKRNPGQYGQYEKTVSEILFNVRERGDEAVFDYTEKFDGKSHPRRDRRSLCGL